MDRRLKFFDQPLTLAYTSPPEDELDTIFTQGTQNTLRTVTITDTQSGSVYEYITSPRFQTDKLRLSRLIERMRAGEMSRDEFTPIGVPVRGEGMIPVFLIADGVYPFGDADKTFATLEEALTSYLEQGACAVVWGHGDKRRTSHLALESSIPGKSVRAVTAARGAAFFREKIMENDAHVGWRTFVFLIDARIIREKDRFKGVRWEIMPLPPRESHDPLLPVGPDIRTLPSEWHSFKDLIRQARRLFTAWEKNEEERREILRMKREGYAEFQLFREYRHLLDDTAKGGLLKVQHQFRRLLMRFINREEWTAYQYIVECRSKKDLKGALDLVLESRRLRTMLMFVDLFVWQPEVPFAQASGMTVSAILREIFEQAYPAAPGIQEELMDMARAVIPPLDSSWD